MSKPPTMPSSAGRWVIILTTDRCCCVALAREEIYLSKTQTYTATLEGFWAYVAEETCFVFVPWIPLLRYSVFYSGQFQRTGRLLGAASGILALYPQYFSLMYVWKDWLLHCEGIHVVYTTLKMQRCRAVIHQILIIHTYL